MKLMFAGSRHEFREVLCRLLGCSHHPHPHPEPKARLIVLTLDCDEPIPAPEPMPNVTLTTAIKPGFRRPFTLTFDEPVDLRPDGVSYVSTEIIDGDSTVVLTEQSKTGAKGFLNGDGSIGAKTVRFSADGHVGDGDVEITLDVTFPVASPDATVIGFKESGPDGGIPA